MIFGQTGNFKKKDRQQLNQQQLKKSAAHNLVNFSLLEGKKVLISAPLHLFSPFASGFSIIRSQLPVCVCAWQG